MFHIFSRLNHSCAPNVVRNIISEDSGELSIVAAADIDKGCEIFIKVTLKIINTGLSTLAMAQDCHVF